MSRFSRSRAFCARVPKSIAAMRPSAAARTRSTMRSVLDNIGDGAALYETTDLATIVDRVKTAMERLPEEQRVAVELAYYEGLTHTEISARLHQPMEATKTRIKLGMAKLRESLRQDWVQSEHP